MRWADVLGDSNYFGGVEPDQIERIEIQRRVRTVKYWPGSKLSGSEARDDNTRQLGRMSGEVAATAVAIYDAKNQKKKDEGESQSDYASAFHQLNTERSLHAEKKFQCRVKETAAAAAAINQL